jgi:rSAM/selenodomain-associated transferase 2
VISVVLPVYNEERALPATLTQLCLQDGDYEIIAVDGGSSDATLEILAGYSRIQVLKAPKGRAIQMNTGAAAAQGEWLVFLHADTQLPPRALSRLNDWESQDEIQAGGFRHRFSGDRWSLRFVSWLDNLRCRITYIVYGDQAMFVRRSLFRELGGFPDNAPMEDVAFGEKLVEVTRPILLRDHVITDSRKFEQMGVWSSLSRVLSIQARYEIGLRISGSRFFSDIR